MPSHFEYCSRVLEGYDLAMNRISVVASALTVLVAGCGSVFQTGRTMTLVLTVSNPNPKVDGDFTEQVTFQCEPVGGSGGVTEIVFGGDTDRLVVDYLSGSAFMILDASDVGRTLSFTCSARDSRGETLTSNEVLVTPAA